MRPPPDPDDPHHVQPGSDVAGVPDEEGVDPGSVEDDLALEPDEKPNATDGYAPADDPDAPDTLDLDQSED